MKSIGMLCKNKGVFSSEGNHSPELGMCLKSSGNSTKVGVVRVEWGVWGSSRDSDKGWGEVVPCFTCPGRISGE